MTTVKFIPKFEGWLSAALLFFFVSLSVGPMPPALHAQSLLKQSDLVYQGAFRLPRGQWGNTSVSDGFSYGGSALAFNPANDSLFIVGHDHQQMVAEISIPTVVNSSQLSQLSTAKVLQPFTDATEGKMAQFNTGSGVKIGGLMVYDGKLYVSAYDFYDAKGRQVLSHFVRPINISDKGHVLGPFSAGKMGAGFVDGWMIPVPQAWQSSLAAPAITGNCCLNIISRTSFGPAAFGFNPLDLGKIIPAPTVPFVYYPSSHTTLGPWSAQSVKFNGTTVIRGAVFPEETSSILFFGRQGLGPWCYGPGTANQSLAGTRAPSGQTYCYDPTSDATGPHAPPYVYQVWAYNAADFAKVKAGGEQPWDVVPYEVWNFELPFQTANRILGGVAYDRATQRIFVAQSSAESNGMPMIHVWKVGATVSKKTSTAPSAPTNLTVSDAAILTWSTGSQLNSSDVVEIERSAAGDPFVRIASVEATVASVVDPAALGSVCYRVRSVVQTSPSEYSNTACAMVIEGADLVITLEDGLVPSLRRRTNDNSKHVEITVGKSATVIINGQVQ